MTAPTLSSRSRTSEYQIRNRSPSMGYSMSVMEVGNHKYFSPSVPAAIEISRGVYARLSVDSGNFTRSLLPEYLDYYTTACIWIRIINLKRSNDQPITEQEKSILGLTDCYYFNVPSVILSLIKQLGNIETCIGQHLYPQFPPLPVHIINNLGGFYGELENDENLHNLYEEIPCLGVLADAVMNTIGNKPIGNYESRLSFRGLQPNQNLLGFRPLSYRCNCATNTAHVAGITEHDFGENPAAFNMVFLKSISKVLYRSSMCNMASVNFKNLSVMGSQCQVIISRPVTGQQTINILGKIVPTSLSMDSSNWYGESIFFSSQLIKTPGYGNNHSMWCAFTPTEDVPIPTAWIQNRNARRDLPIMYYEEVFKGKSQFAAFFRTNIINTFFRM